MLTPVTCTEVRIARNQKQWKFLCRRNNENCQSFEKNTTNTGLKTFIFFYFECTQDDYMQCERGYEKQTKGRRCANCKQSWCGTKQHRPNLCVAHKVCENCMDENVNEKSWCDHCGKKEQIFYGENSRDDFCRWLFSEQIVSSKVLCHNFKGYDSYPILPIALKDKLFVSCSPHHVFLG